MVHRIRRWVAGAGRVATVAPDLTREPLASHAFPGGVSQRAEVAGAAVGRCWKKVQLKKRGKDWVGLSPFSSEKTPSFYVHDDRGFYKCFSTQKSGDAITFLVETERLTFSEAVEKLARDYGLELPKQWRRNSSNTGGGRR